MGRVAELERQAGQDDVAALHDEIAELTDQLLQLSEDSAQVRAVYAEGSLQSMLLNLTCGNSNENSASLRMDTWYNIIFLTVSRSNAPLI